MASPASLGSRALRASRRQISVPNLQRRGLAAAASGSFGYETGEANGVKFASRDLPGPTTTLTVVAKAGTRYQPLPGLSDALEKFAFKVGGRSPRGARLQTNIGRSLPQNDRRCGLLEKQSCWGVRRRHTTPAKTSSYEPNSFAMTYRISPSC
jgi:hypothetical protein